MLPDCFSSAYNPIRYWIMSQIHYCYKQKIVFNYVSILYYRQYLYNKIIKQVCPHKKVTVFILGVCIPLRPTLCVLILSMSGRTYSLKSTLNDRFLRNFMAILFTFRVFA